MFFFLFCLHFESVLQVFGNILEKTHVNNAAVNVLYFERCIIRMQFGYLLRAIRFKCVLCCLWLCVCVKKEKKSLWSNVIFDSYGNVHRTRYCAYFLRSSRFLFCIEYVLFFSSFASFILSRLLFWLVMNVYFSIFARQIKVIRKTAIGKKVVRKVKNVQKISSFFFQQEKDE